MEPWLLIAVIGFAAGAMAFYLIPGKHRGGLIVTAIVGAVGALATAELGKLVGAAMPGQTSGFFAAVIGAALILAVWCISWASAISGNHGAAVSACAPRQRSYRIANQGR